MEGLLVGSSVVGLEVRFEGDRDGVLLGEADVGCFIGEAVGLTVVCFSYTGDRVGDVVGPSVAVGAALGDAVGEAVGLDVGEGVGEDEGVELGWSGSNPADAEGERNVGLGEMITIVVSLSRVVGLDVVGNLVLVGESVVGNLVVVGELVTRIGRFVGLFMVGNRVVVGNGVGRREGLLVCAATAEKLVNNNNTTNTNHILL